MGVASVLTEIREEIKGTVKFIFQPAEEGAPDGEEGGAELMVKEGVLKNPDVDAIFGLHISSGVPINTLTYKPGGTMASASYLTAGPTAVFTGLCASEFAMRGADPGHRWQGYYRYDQHTQPACSPFRPCQSML